MCNCLVDNSWQETEENRPGRSRGRGRGRGRGGERWQRKANGCVCGRGWLAV